MLCLKQGVPIRQLLHTGLKFVNIVLDVMRIPGRDPLGTHKVAHLSPAVFDAVVTRVDAITFQPGIGRVRESKREEGPVGKPMGQQGLELGLAHFFRRQGTQESLGLGFLFFTDGGWRGGLSPLPSIASMVYLQCSVV